MRRLLLALALLTALPAAAQEDVEILARRAAGQLEAAQNALASAERAGEFSMDCSTPSSRITFSRCDSKRARSVASRIAARRSPSRRAISPAS